jgi:hypothetical protein
VRCAAAFQCSKLMKRLLREQLATAGLRRHQPAGLGRFRRVESTQFILA